MELRRAEQPLHILFFPAEKGYFIDIYSTRVYTEKAGKTRRGDAVSSLSRNTGKGGGAVSAMEVLILLSLIATVASVIVTAMKK